MGWWHEHSGASLAGLGNDMKNLAPFRSVLIFGGAGFVGSNWASHLLARNDARIHVFDNLSRAGVRHNLDSLQRQAAGTDRLKITLGDICDASLVRQAVKSATEIYHFAAQVAVTTSVDDPQLDFGVNLVGTFNILEAARQCGRAPFLLFTSTNKVYGHMSRATPALEASRYRCGPGDGIRESQPLDFYSPYGCSKGAADQYVHDYARIYGLPTVVFRMSCIAGPRQFGNEDQGWMAHFLYSALRGKPVTIYGDGRQVRDVLCVDDLVRAMEAAAANVSRTAGQVYNVGGGYENSISLLELVEEIERLTGRKLRYDFGRPRPGDQPVYITNYSKLREHTGWQPHTGVRRTLARIYGWWREHQELLAPTPPAFGMAGAALCLPETGAAS